MAVLVHGVVLLEVRLPLELDDAEVNVDLVVANEIVLLGEILLCTVDAIEFNFPTILSQELDDIISKGLAVEGKEYQLEILLQLGECFEAFVSQVQLLAHRL